jgi:hypothetical protein
MPFRARADFTPRRARLTVRGFGSLGAEVLAAGPRARALRLAPDPPVPVRFLHRRAAVLEGADGRLDEGILIAVEGRDGALALDRLDFVPHGQRREFVRVPAVVPVTAALPDVPRVWGSGRTVDISGGGALVTGMRLPARDEALLLDLALPTAGAAVRGAATVVRMSPDGLLAVSFDDMEERDREQIFAFVARVQRELLHRRRTAR